MIGLLSLIAMIVVPILCGHIFFLLERVSALEESNRRLWAANQSLTNCLLDLHPGRIVIDDQRDEGEFLQ